MWRERIYSSWTIAILEKLNKAEAYYMRGRHNNCDTFYISQNYFELLHQTICENANLIILFPQDIKNLIHIHADHCDEDVYCRIQEIL